MATKAMAQSEGIIIIGSTFHLCVSPPVVFFREREREVTRGDLTTESCTLHYPVLYQGWSINERGGAQLDPFRSINVHWRCT